MRLPRPYEDELVGSMVARGIVYTGLPTKKFLFAVTGRTANTLSFFLPSDLSSLASAAALDTKVLLWNHTVFPYVTAFMRGDEVARLEIKTLISPPSRERSLSSLVKSVTRGLKCLQYCPACRSKEVAQLGESYWHRGHNLPAIYLCHVHGEPLVRVSMPSASRAFEIGLPHHHTQPAVKHNSPRAVLEDVSSRAASLLVMRPSVDEDLPQRYRAQALQAGYVLASGDSAGVQLARDLRKHFGDALLEEAGCEVPPDAKNPWPALMLRPATGIPFAPTKHLLLRSFLENAPAGEKPLSYRAPGKRTRDYGQLDRCLASHMRKAMLRAQRQNVRLTVQMLAGDTGLWSSFRHDRERFPASCAVLDEYRKSDIAERQEGRRPYWRKRLGLERAAENPT